MESHFNIEKMYEMYVSNCEADKEIPVKSSYYRHVFVTEYNLDFHIPKSARCDLCEAYKVMKANKGCNASLAEKYESHLTDKQAMRDARNSDTRAKGDYGSKFRLGKCDHTTKSKNQ